MTRFLLENIYGSSGSGGSTKSGSVDDSNLDEVGYLPSVYMIRRLGGLDDISFKLFRYARVVDGVHDSSHGLIAIELIESSHVGGSKVTSQAIQDGDKKLLSKLDNEIKISADLTYTTVNSSNNKKSAAISIPHGKLYARANQQVAVVSDQVHVNKPVSPVIFSVALDCELAEQLWAGFEQEVVTLELSIHWLLTGEERGVPFQHVITQAIPINTSMSAQRNCFHKFETWADFEHDHSELHVQCFSLFDDNNTGLSHVEVAVDLKDGENIIATKAVEFKQQDSESTKTLLFPEAAELLKPDFDITTTYHFDDGTTNEVESLSHKLRYFDASLKKK